MLGYRWLLLTTTRSPNGRSSQLVRYQIKLEKCKPWHEPKGLLSQGHDPTGGKDAWKTNLGPQPAIWGQEHFCFGRQKGPCSQAAHSVQSLCAAHQLHALRGYLQYRWLFCKIEIKLISQVARKIQQLVRIMLTTIGQWETTEVYHDQNYTLLILVYTKSQWSII